MFDLPLLVTSINEVLTMPEQDNKELGQPIKDSSDSSPRQSENLKQQVQTGIKDLADDTKQYYEARRGGLRDRHTAELFGVKPDFFDSKESSHPAPPAERHHESQIDSKAGESAREAESSNILNKTLQQLSNVLSTINAQLERFTTARERNTDSTLQHDRQDHDRARTRITKERDKVQDLLERLQQTTVDKDALLSREGEACHGQEEIDYSQEMARLGLSVSEERRAETVNSRVARVELRQMNRALWELSNEMDDQSRLLQLKRAEESGLRALEGYDKAREHTGRQVQYLTEALELAITYSDKHDIRLLTRALERADRSARVLDLRRERLSETLVSIQEERDRLSETDQYEQEMTKLAEKVMEDKRQEQEQSTRARLQLKEMNQALEQYQKATATTDKVSFLTEAEKKGKVAIEDFGKAKGFAQALVEDLRKGVELAVKNADIDQQEELGRLFRRAERKVQVLDERTKLLDKTLQGIASEKAKLKQQPEVDSKRKEEESRKRQEEEARRKEEELRKQEEAEAKRKEEKQEAKRKEEEARKLEDERKQAERIAQYQQDMSKLAEAVSGDNKQEKEHYDKAQTAVTEMNKALERFNSDSTIADKLTDLKTAQEKATVGAQEFGEAKKEAEKKLEHLTAAMKLAEGNSDQETKAGLTKAQEETKKEIEAFEKASVGLGEQAKGLGKVLIEIQKALEEKAKQQEIEQKRNEVQQLLDSLTGLDQQRNSYNQSASSAMTGADTSFQSANSTAQEASKYARDAGNTALVTKIEETLAAAQQAKKQADQNNKLLIEHAQASLEAFTQAHKDFSSNNYDSARTKANEAITARNSTQTDLQRLSSNVSDVQLKSQELSKLLEQAKEEAKDKADEERKQLELEVKRTEVKPLIDGLKDLPSKLSGYEGVAASGVADASKSFTDGNVSAKKAQDIATEIGDNDLVKRITETQTALQKAKEQAEKDQQALQEHAKSARSASTEAQKQFDGKNYDNAKTKANGANEALNLAEKDNTAIGNDAKQAQQHATKLAELLKEAEGKFKQAQDKVAADKAAAENTRHKEILDAVSTLLAADKVSADDQQKHVTTALTSEDTLSTEQAKGKNKGLATENRVAALDNAIAAATQSSNEYSEAKKLAQARITTLSKAIEDLPAKEGELQTIEDKIEAVRDSLSTYDDKISDLKQTIRDLEKSKNQLETRAKKEVEDLFTELGTQEELSQALTQLKTDSTKASADAATYAEQANKEKERAAGFATILDPKDEFKIQASRASEYATQAANEAAKSTAAATASATTLSTVNKAVTDGLKAYEDAVQALNEGKYDLAKTKATAAIALKNDVEKEAINVSDQSTLAKNSKNRAFDKAELSRQQVVDVTSDLRERAEGYKNKFGGEKGLLHRATEAEATTANFSTQAARLATEAKTVANTLGTTAGSLASDAATKANEAKTASDNALKFKKELLATNDTVSNTYEAALKLQKDGQYKEAINTFKNVVSAAAGAEATLIKIEGNKATGAQGEREKAEAAFKSVEELIKTSLNNALKPLEKIDATFTQKRSSADKALTAATKYVEQANTAKGFGESLSLLLNSDIFIQTSPAVLKAKEQLV
ncbi:MAG: hypothetical protein HY711_00490, partial [Candidatus Melainabacteria bacterium]|nr:hypothetical protein [Candidatus Melainabacteria bacterium]